MVKFFIRYLQKRGYLVLKGSDDGKTVYFDVDNNKWCAWKRF